MLNVYTIYSENPWCKEENILQHVSTTQGPQGQNGDSSRAKYKDLIPEFDKISKLYINSH